MRRRRSIRARRGRATSLTPILTKAAIGTATIAPTTPRSDAPIITARRVVSGESETVRPNTTG